MLSIVITGPESSGKTTLTAQLAAHFGAEWLPEFARSYLENLGRSYGEPDLLDIAKGQLESEKILLNDENEICFLDTSLEVIKIWSEVVYGRCHPFILNNLRQQKHDFYLLCRPDLPWEPDPLRENPKNRDELFERYFTELNKLNVNFVEIGGQGSERFEIARQAVLQFRKLHLENNGHRLK